MSDNNNAKTTDQAQPEAAKPADAAPAAKKGWISGRTAAYTVAGAVVVIGLGAAAWAMLKSPKAVEAVVDAAA